MKLNHDKKPLTQLKDPATKFEFGSDLVMRHLNMNDVEAVTLFNQENALSKSIFQPQSLSKEQVIAYIQRYIDRDANPKYGAFFGVFKGKEMVGIFSVNEINTNKELINIGFAMATKFENKGFASAFGVKILDKLFSDFNLQQITCYTDATSNPLAYKLVNKLMFVENGIGETPSGAKYPAYMLSNDVWQIFKDNKHQFKLLQEPLDKGISNDQTKALI